jgi:GH25 family lysozyme M1 (1,4-beta-N-acetylmuramidase)
VSRMTLAVRTSVRTSGRRTARATVGVVAAVATVAAGSIAVADGIDVSHWQGTIRWSQVKSDGISFAFMKATEGTTYPDPTLKTNWAGAQAVGIYRGAYHFARPSTGTAAAQARYFVSKVGSFSGAGVLPPVLDLEASGGLGVSALRTWTSTFLTTVESLTGRTPIVYVSPAFWEHYLGNSTAFTRYPLWIAHYGVTAPRVPGGWGRYTFWQRTSSGQVDGIAGDVDMNRFNGSSADLAALANTSGGSTGPVAPGPTIPAAAATRLTLAPGTTTTAAINEPVAFAGDLLTTAGSTAVPGAAVSLLARSAGTSTWSKVAAAVTDTAGHYSTTVRVPRATDYKVTFAGDSAYAGVSSAVTRIITPPRAAARLDLHKNKTYRVRRGAKVMVYGHVTTPAGALPGAYVKFYRRPASGGSWTYIRQVRSLAPTGWYSTNVYPRRGTTYKAVFAGTLFQLPATSNLVTVRVR